MHFHAGIYVCSLSIFEISPKTISRLLNRTPTSRIPGQLSARFFNGNGRRGGSGCPNPRVPASPTCVRTGPFQAKLPGRPTGITPRERTAVLQLVCDLLFTWPADQPRHATKHFNLPGRYQFAPEPNEHHLHLHSTFDLIPNKSDPTGRNFMNSYFEENK